MIFAVATNNQKKLAEIQRILTTLGHEAKTLKQLGVEIEIEETGTTFCENAILKAEAVSKISQMPTISDDSGLEVDILKGEPGVYTARYAGENATDDENIDKLLKNMVNVEKKDREARFVSAVCVYLPNGQHLECVGSCEGWVGFERLGEGGFGYDPIFMVGDKSYSRMSNDEKDAISHRGKALRQLQTKLQDFIK